MYKSFEKFAEAVTFRQVCEEVVRLADESPDYVYPSVGGGGCYYSYGDTPDCKGCIFGQAFQNLGLDKEVLSKFDAATNLADSGVSFLVKAYWPEEYGQYYTRSASNCQIMQDIEKSWSKATAGLKEALQESVGA